MSGNRNNAIVLALDEIIGYIDDYYSATFRISPGKCMPFIIAVAEKMEVVLPILTERQNKKMKQDLEKVLVSMQTEDYVVARDYLFYEIRASLMGVKTELMRQIDKMR